MVIVIRSRRARVAGDAVPVSVDARLKAGHDD
jgi:hypothetical protein